MRKKDVTRHRKKLARKACQGKVRYLDATIAAQTAYALTSKSQETMRAYRCQACGFWHMGHLNKKW